MYDLRCWHVFVSGWRQLLHQLHCRHVLFFGNRGQLLHQLHCRHVLVCDWRFCIVDLQRLCCRHVLAIVRSDQL